MIRTFEIRILFKQRRGRTHYRLIVSLQGFDRRAQLHRHVRLGRLSSEGLPGAVVGQHNGSAHTRLALDLIHVSG